MSGLGTQSSPIYIDSEDEVWDHLTEPAPTAYSESSGQGGSSSADSRSVPSQYDHGSNGQHSGQDWNLNGHQAGQASKRRRSSSPDSQRPAKLARPLEDRLSNPKANNKRKNRQEKQKRQEQEHKKRQQLRQQENLRLLRSAPGLEPQYPPGHAEGMPINPFLLLKFNQTPEIMRALGYTPALPDSAYPPPPPPPLRHGDPSMAWPSAIAWPPPLHSPYPIDPPPNLRPPPNPPPPASLPAHPPKVNLPLPPKPVTHPPIPIGMKHDQDPQSKHGIFDLNSQGSEGSRYIPDPERTLVMEQLPKNWRSHEQLHSWGRHATGNPNPIVKVLVDSRASRALLEFATAELARKGWESPRLGTQYAGLKSHQLKGKPREDLIRVWWYRVQGVGPHEGVGEIEEGEIEEGPCPQSGDTIQASNTFPAGGMNQPLKKAKKQKKARLAIEREQKAHMLHLFRQPPPPPSAELDSRDQISAPSWNDHKAPLRVVPGPPAGEDMDVDDDDDDDMEVESPTQPILNTLVPAVAQPHLQPSIGPVAPTKPSLKEELGARHKFLQEEIDQAKRALALPATLPASGIPASEPKAALESELRARVLQSQRDRQLAAAAKAAATTAAPVISLTDSAKSSVAQDTTSLEDLAVSFIEQTIETVKALPSSIPEPPSAKRAPMSSKAELELKTQRLEQYISQSRVLVEQLIQAKTKQERDLLKAKLKELERQRSADEEASVSPVSIRPAGSKQARAISSVWPMQGESHVLLWSDGESDDEDDGDDD